MLPRRSRPACLLAGAVLLLSLAPSACGAAAPADRALVALVRADRAVHLSWRLLPADAADTGFHIYRATGDEPLRRLNPAPLLATTDFVDRGADLTRSNHWRVRPVRRGREARNGGAEISLAPHSPPRPYVRIALRGNHRFSKVALADLDGDGRLDYVIKQPEQVSDPGVWKPSETTFKIEAYRHDGAFLWQRDLGWNIEQGVWWSPMIAADLDGDGRAEIALKTAPHSPIFRHPSGRILDGPEYLSVWDGQTGRELARVDWPPRGNFEDWGDRVGNRASRHLIGMARLDGRRNSLLALRGTYTTMLVDAWDFRHGRLEKRWAWNGDHDTPPTRGQGMHGLHAADVDGDGREEILLGAALLNPDGKLRWNLGLGHPDIVYVTDVVPARPGLEIAYGFETAQRSNGFCVVAAESGRILWGCAHTNRHIHSQGLLADIDPANPGLEFYGGEKFLTNRWLYSAADGRLLSLEDLGTLAPIAVYWGDTHVKPFVTREGRLALYRGPELARLEGRIIAVADVLGDWREEIITSVTGELRIYTTTIPAACRHVWLMADPLYRSGVAHAAMGYLFPPQLTRPLTDGSGH